MLSSRLKIMKYLCINGNLEVLNKTTGSTKCSHKNDTKRVKKNNMIIRYPACGTGILERERSTEKNETRFQSRITRQDFQLNSPKNETHKYQVQKEPDVETLNTPYVWKPNVWKKGEKRQSWRLYHNTVIDSLQVCKLNKIILIPHLHHAIAKIKMETASIMLSIG